MEYPRAMAKLGIRYRPGDLRLLEDVPALGADERPLAPREVLIYELEGALDARPAVLLPNAQAAAYGQLPTVRFVRRATPADLKQLDVKWEEEAKAHLVAAEKIQAHGLRMKLVDALYTLDFSRLTFYYTADGRVDFRELLRDLTGTFRRTRILLRQIGVRDETKHLSGVGSCGKELCCATFLTDFAPINIRLAKEQDLSLNPAKLSGACGRLKCCLNYEVDTYREAKRELPRRGERVLTALGEGRVVEAQPANERAFVELADGRVLRFGLAEMNRLAPDFPDAPAPEEGAPYRPSRPGRPHRRIDPPTP